MKLVALAKYREDIEERYNEDIDNKNWESRWGKNELERLKEPIKLKTVNEEFSEIKERLTQIESWISFDKALLKFITSNNIVGQLKAQLKHLDTLKDRYLNQYYDPKFNSKRDDSDLNVKDVLKKYYEPLKIDFLRYLLEKGAELRNNNNSDALQVNEFFWDMESYLKEIYSVDKSKITIPLIKLIREDILNQCCSETVLCERCNNLTYKDFHICIFCNSDRGGI